MNKRFSVVYLDGSYYVFDILSRKTLYGSYENQKGAAQFARDWQRYYDGLASGEIFQIHYYDKTTGGFTKSEETKQ